MKFSIKYCWYCVSLFLLLFSPVLAAERIFRAEDTYILTDNDTRNDGRRICFFHARQKIIDTVQDYLVRKNPKEAIAAMEPKTLRQYLTVLLEITAKNENWRFTEQELSITIAAETMIDESKLIKQLQAIEDNPEAIKKIQNDISRLQIIEKEYLALEKQLATAGQDSVVPLRKERQVIATEIDRIEAVRYLIASKTKLVSEKISTGMTIDELISIAGQPRATATCEKPDFLNYGNIWVWINNGLVIGKIPIEKWSGPCYRYSLADKTQRADSVSENQKETGPSGKPKYEIWLKTGQTIFTSSYYEVNDIIYYKKYGGIIGLEKEKIEAIKEVE